MQWPVKPPKPKPAMPKDGDRQGFCMFALWPTKVTRVTKDDTWVWFEHYYVEEVYFYSMANYMLNRSHWFVVLQSPLTDQNDAFKGIRKITVKEF